MYKGTKITLRAKLYKTKQKAGQKAVNNRCREQCCEISQPAKFRNLLNLKVANFRNPAEFP